MDMEYTFHLPKIIVSLNKLTWSESLLTQNYLASTNYYFVFSGYPCAWL